MYDKKHTDRGVIEVLYYVNAAFNIDKYNVMYLQQLLCCKAIYIYRGRMVFSLCSVFIDHLFLCASE